MRTLFAKILLWFWAALAVMIGVLVVLEAASRQRGFAPPPGGHDPFRLQHDLVQEALTREGRAGLPRVMAFLREHGGVRTFVIDSSGVVLAGGPAPATAVQVGRWVAARGERQMRDGGAGIGYAGGPLRSPDGTRLAVVTEARRPRMPFFPFLPHDLASRGFALVVVGGLGCYLLARYITAPVERLRRATQRLAAGDLTARVGAEVRGRRDELEDLGQDFDRMAARLESLVTAQRRLLSDISHELRSPLARMSLAIGLLRQRDTEDPDGMIGRLETEAERLNRMIGDLLTLSRLEAGDPAAATRTVELGDIAEEVALDADFEAGARGCEVKLSRFSRASVSGVPELLHSAIENVVRNAVRHTAEGTTVELRVEGPGRDHADVVVEVIDHGPGVPERELERIFEPFVRVDEARDRRQGGTGLGLAIARRAVHQHGGTIEARRAPGGGLQVVMRLPAAGR